MKNYKWIYTKDNFLPYVQDIKLKKFFNSTFNFDLGWEPLANSEKNEYYENKKIGKLKFDHESRRFDPNEKNKISNYVVFGDSYALSRQVNESETIAHFLGNAHNQYFPNYGVGNYGLDQAYLRYLKYESLLKDKHAIFIIVPETIVRINTRWRHFHETGNIFGFKPMFSINKNYDLLLNKNPIENFSDYEIIFSNFVNQNSFLIDDPMYKLRFEEEAVNLKNLFKLKIATFSKLIEYGEWLIKNRYLKSIDDVYGMSIRMKSNSKFTNKCYSTKQTKALLEKLILEIKKRTRNNMSIFVIPQLSDLKIDFSKRKYFFKKLRDIHNVKVYDCSDYLIQKMGSRKKIDLLYVEKGFGGHLNKKGNFIISQWIKELIK